MNPRPVHPHLASDHERIVLVAGHPVTIGQIRGTLRLLRWYQKFIRSDASRANVPMDWTRSTMTKDEAQRSLTRMVLVGIQRKAGIPDVPSRKHESDYQRAAMQDARDINGWFRKRIICRVSQLRLPETRARFRDRLFEDD